MTRRRLLLTESAVLVGVGLLAWLASPPAGVLLHWSPDETTPWRAPAAAYAVVVALVALGVGRIVTSVVNADATRTRSPLRAECAAGTVFIAFAGLQRLDGLSVLIAALGAVLLGLALYSATSRMP